MDFWGINRSHNSLRLHILKRLLAVAKPNDVTRFADTIPELVTGRPLAPKEAEVLLAFVSGVRSNSGNMYDAMKPNLAVIFYSSLEIWVDEGELVAPSAVESCALRFGKCLARQASSDLAYFFAKKGDTVVLSKFLELFEEKWMRHELLSDSEFVALYGAFLGCLEGITSANNASSIEDSFFERISACCNSEFLIAVQNHLASIQEVFELSIPAFLDDVAKISALYAPQSGKNLRSVLELSGQQLEKLDGSQQFQIDVNFDHITILQSAMEAHFRVFEYALSQDDAYYDNIYNHVSRALGDNELYYEPLTSTLARIAAKLSGYSYQCLVQLFTRFTEFISHLDASSAYRSAHQFADTCKDNFTDESSRIKLLYSLINKLTIEEYDLNYSNYGEKGALEWVASILSATVAVVSAFESSDFAGLAVTMLDQKLETINQEVGAQVVETWGLLVPYLTGPKFDDVLERLVHVDRRGKPKLVAAVKHARITIATKWSDSNRYLNHLLDLLVLNGDPSETASIRNLYAPLATLLSHSAPTMNHETQSRFHNVWLNLAAIGVTTGSLKGEDLRDLKIVAKNAPPLVSDDSADHVESDLQLNPVLCRDLDSNALKVQHNAINEVLSHKTSQHFSSPRIIYMAATLLLEELRTWSGSISKLPHYFEDTEIGTGQGHAPMAQLCRYLTEDYVANLGYCSEGTLISMAQNLKELVVLSCHRVEPVRHMATEMISKIVSEIPAALCQHDALYTLLDCLTLLHDSNKNAIEDEFSPKAVFVAPLSGVTLQLGDNLAVRRKSLKDFERLARTWVAKIATILLPDLRSKLYTYLGNSKTVGRGRMFALEVLSTREGDDDFFTQYSLLSRYSSSSTCETADSIISKFRSAKSAEDLQSIYTTALPYIYNDTPQAMMIAEESVRAPFRIFTDEAISAGITFWHHSIRHQEKSRPIIVNQVVEQSILTVSERKSLFNRELDDVQPLWSEMEYAPTNKKKLVHHETMIMRRLKPHMKLLSGFIRSCMHNSVLLNQHYMILFNRLTVSWLEGLIEVGSLHSIARNLRIEVLEYAIDLLKFMYAFQKSSSPINRKLALQLEKLIVKAGLSWYNQPVPQWPYGSNIKEQARTLRLLKFFASYLSSSRSIDASLLRNLVSQEFNKLSAWHDPLGPATVIPTEYINRSQLQAAWDVNPHLAVQIGKGWRLYDAQTFHLLEYLVDKHLLSVYNCPEALNIYLESRRSLKDISPLVILWSQVSPIESINLLSPHYGEKLVIQYALRSLEMHPITVCFFYVPQIVQQLRHDESGMVSEYILEAAKFSQKFAHQIIWNIMANMYMDDDGTIPDPMKPQLDEVLNRLKGQFDQSEKDYYETEFKFFSEVTGISGKLKPYIKKSKAEKKEKIDEEMSRIEVPEGVYLPSHPDGTVVDIDRTGGKPMQSHAKAPFLARFKIRLDVDEIDDEDNAEVQRQTKELWQGAIFKVGDDCRQDVLALQVISVFQSVFNFCGLDVYLFPYKVTATAAGRGVIDVLPNSISRDMLGREAVNGLDQWFQSKHGGPNSIEFQRARLNFVKSMAAYSVITYLIQFKDRHNGNIMYDDDGHVIHIDFGFCFDIAPGGVRFEAAPFKLTKEMVRVMGGSQSSLPFQWFEKLCVQVFLASRVFVDDICRVVIPMLESGLPCFKGQTIRRLRERFVLHKTETEAAQYMRSLISKSYESNYTKGYDEFQRLTNGIPY